MIQRTFTVLTVQVMMMALLNFYPEFKDRDMIDPKFVVGMKFSNIEQIKVTINKYAMKNMYNIRFIKNDERRIYVKYNDSYP